MLLDISFNSITDLQQLAYLTANINLKVINLIGNPLCRWNVYKEEVLSLLQSIETLDPKDIVKASSFKHFQSLGFAPMNGVLRSVKAFN